MVRGSLQAPSAPVRRIEVLRWRFAPSFDAPRIARRLVADVVPRDGNTDVMQLLVSEIVTNAVLHTGRPGELCVELDPHVVHIEVRDVAHATPRVKAVAGADGGWGMRIVTALADGWGVARRGRGKSVWFEVYRNPAVDRDLELRPSIDAGGMHVSFVG